MLNQLYGDITIPQAVFHEITVIGAGQAGAEEVKTLSWFSTVTTVVLDDLIATAGFWVDNALYRRILQIVGEDNAS